MDSNTTPSVLIDRLGGTTAVAKMCDLKPPSVSEWRKAGIPKPWLKFLRLARPDAFSDTPSAPTPHPLYGAGEYGVTDRRVDPDRRAAGPA